MYIMFIGDLHIKTSNAKQIAIAQNDIMRELTLSGKKFLFIVIMGDTLDNHEKIDMECLNRAADLFEMIMTTGIPLFVLIGNHDRANNKVYMTNRHPFRGFNGRSGIAIIERCYVHSVNARLIGIDSDGLMNFCFVPFIPDGRYMEALRDCNINPMDMTMFLSHSEFKGCKINKVSKNECDTWPLEYPLNISGHIHNEEVVQENLIYIGTPFQHTYSEDCDKGIFVMNLLTGDYKLEKIKLNIPKKIVLKVHYTQLEALKPDPNYDIRLEIHGPTQYVRYLMTRPDLKDKFSGMSKKYIEEGTGSVQNLKNGPLLEKTSNIDFYEQLMVKISGDEKMKLVYGNIANSLRF